MTALATDFDALLRAVCERPDDDAPRLVYADVLEERGEVERAEFIRCQVELARLYERRPGHNAGTSTGGNPMPRWREAIDALRERERELLASGIIQPPIPGALVCLPGSEPPPAHASRYPMVCIVRRGFVDEVRCTTTTLTGGPCGTCQGTGAIERLDSGYMRRFGLRQWNGCKACGGEGERRGTGTLPSIAAQLGRLPLTTIRLTDREPNETAIERERVSVWTWWREGNGPEAARLPIALFEKLIDRHGTSFVVPRQSVTVDDFPSPDLAHAALSAAALRLIRQRAGLPDLTAAR
jgi:uncharacterized protein (TIGR02996 family)